MADLEEVRMAASHLRTIPRRKGWQSNSYLFQWRLYSEQMLRIAKALNINVSTSGNRPKDKIWNCLYPGAPGIVALPILEDLTDLTVPIW